ncbi:polysaccharide pyruvyl transferase family protein, partial [Photobacterium lucens]|uniref:polysaccharide pyruvyl transferase family protein n=1 Tax=Photobacterium lucens TaxID=2562949 RepID=UPI00136A2615
LGFSTKVNKVAYASSFGVSDWEYSESQTILVKKLIKDFKAVSVRENDGVLLCKDYLNVDSCCVADPTLLLEKSLYEDLCHDLPSFNKQKYLFYYVLDNNKDKQNYAIELAKKLNLDILIVENKNEGLFLT